MIRRRNPAQVRTRHYQWKLDERITLVLDANGRAEGQLAPGGARERWVVTSINVTATNVPAASVNVPQLIIYRSSAIPGNELGGTFNALMDSSTDYYELNMNEPLVFQASQGDVDSILHIHIEGVRHVWG